MVNNVIVKQIREIIPIYRYNVLKEFYSNCKTKHHKLAKYIVLSSISNNFEHPETIKPEAYIIKAKQVEDYTGTRPITSCCRYCYLPVYVKYINEDNNKFTYVNVTDDYMCIYLNVFYVTEHIQEYVSSLMTDLFYFEYCSENHIISNDKSTYVTNMTNDLDLKETDYNFIKNMILLISPSERILRKQNVVNKLNELTLDRIDIICYGMHGLSRVCALINYMIDTCYYNMFHFFLYHFYDETDDEIKQMLQLGYYLNKLKIFDIDITKEYIKNIQNIDYKITRHDKVLAREVYKFYNNYFDEYLYDFYKTIDSCLDKRDEI